MITVNDIREWIETLGISEEVYANRLDAAKTEAIGVYNSKHQHEYKIAIGGHALESYRPLFITLLVHWNTNPPESEETARALFSTIESARNVHLGERKDIIFVQMLYEPQDIGTDENGICEWVIECAFICRKGDINA